MIIVLGHTESTEPTEIINSHTDRTDLTDFNLSRRNGGNGRKACDRNWCLTHSILCKYVSFLMFYGLNLN